jgi:uncharacterized membrane protein
MFTTNLYTHLYLALTTFLVGAFIYISRQKFWFKNPFVMFYMHLHLLTAITGLFIGELNIARFSLFQWLSIITILSYLGSMTRIFKGRFEKAKYPMLGAYFGLCIAFAGALHPDRLSGSRLWTNFLRLNEQQALTSWSVLMVLVSVPCLVAIAYYNIIEFRQIKD